MELNQEQRTFITREFTRNPAIINFIANGLIAWLTYGGRAGIPVWGTEGIISDIILTLFLLPFLTCLIVIIVY